MIKWLDELRIRKGLRNIIIIFLVGLVYFLPQPYVLTDIAYVLIIFLLAYLSSYIETDSLWKGLLYSLIVTIIVVVVFLTIITLFPQIPYVLLLVTVCLTTGLSIYWNG
ncbi:hypothetical protein BTR25_19390 [Bacillus sp. MRMR6]|nr:hypothetical protein BTR25_19390 [Bacillus sp. MRMR6]